MKEHKFVKSEKPVFTNPTFFAFRIRIPQDAMGCENVARFHRRKFKIVINKAIKR